MPILMIVDHSGNYQTITSIYYHTLRLFFPGIPDRANLASGDDNINLATAQSGVSTYQRTATH